MYHSNLILDKEYCEKKFTYFGILFLLISFFLWYHFKNSKINLTLFYSLVELVGFWFILKPSLCNKSIPNFFKCNFYVFALHNPILIPKTQEFIIRFFSGKTFCGMEVIFIKIIQIMVIVLICAIIRYIICKLVPFVDKYLTGGR